MRWDFRKTVDFMEAADRHAGRLYLPMMDKMNVRLPKFGDATKALEEV